MSTKTKTSTPKAPKQGTVAAAHQRISELEAKLKEPHQCPVVELNTTPETRQYNGRVDMPSYGIPLPKGIGFHGYVDIRLEDDVINGKVVAPSEGDVLSLLRLKAEKEFPGFVDVKISDISILPQSWEETGQEEE